MPRLSRRSFTETTLRVVFLAAAIVPTCLAANLAVSTYFKDGFTPAAMVTDAQGNVPISGSAGTTGAAVVKLDSKASRYLYFTYLDNAASDQVSSVAVDGAGNAYIAGRRRLEFAAGHHAEKV
jgi:hypothetical protein